jgi:ribosomal protein L44E
MKGFGGKRRRRPMLKDSIKKDLKEVRLDCVECNNLSADSNNWRALVDH